jgi:hypothetical protein
MKVLCHSHVLDRLRDESAVSIAAVVRLANLARDCAADPRNSPIPLLADLVRSKLLDHVDAGEAGHDGRLIEFADWSHHIL